MSASESFFPKLICCARIDAQHAVNDQSLYDVKFWPYTLEGEEQIFAIVGSSEVAVCRTVTRGEPPFEVLFWWTDTHDGASLNSVVWMKEPSTGKPWLCLGGVSPREIVVLDIEQKKPVRQLAGHGRSINELVVSPTSPNILASCSEDFTVRLWNLEPTYSAQPCVAILAGEAHRQPLLACAFHPNGRWILSGAMDTAVALWAVPTDEELARQDKMKDEPISIVYPHFFSTEVHHNYVDSLAFYGDLIISRCARQQNDSSKQHEILLWKIDGFHSEQDQPRDIDVPRPGVETRSSFPHSQLSQGFQRLLTFAMPNTDRFYLRFGLYHSAGTRPMLCMGSVLSKFSFWDLQKLENSFVKEGNTAAIAKGVARKIPRKRNADGEELRTGVLKGLEREGSVFSSTSKDTGSSAANFKAQRDVLEDPFNPVKPHHTITANTEVAKKHFAAYATSWSPDGRWVIAVGDHSTIAMMYRERVK